MWYVISKLKDGEEIKSCDFFISKWHSKKEMGKEFKFNLLFDLVIYNAFYNNEIPDIKIMIDNEWKDWIKAYPKFKDSISIRNFGKYSNIINDIEKALSLNQRLLTVKEIDKIVNDLCLKYNI
jgi:hypothetical protein